MLTGSIVFFMVALRAASRAIRAADPGPGGAYLPSPLAAAAAASYFPLCSHPVAHRGRVALLASSEDTTKFVLILSLLTLVMCLDLLTMLFARCILRSFAIIVLQVPSGRCSPLRPAGRPVSSVHAARTAVLESVIPG